MIVFYRSIGAIYKQGTVAFHIKLKRLYIFAPWHLGSDVTVQNVSGTIKQYTTFILGEVKVRIFKTIWSKNGKSCAVHRMANVLHLSHALGGKRQLSWLTAAHVPNVRCLAFAQCHISCIKVYKFDGFVYWILQWILIPALSSAKCIVQETLL